MRRSTSIAGPVVMISAYYAVFIIGFMWLVNSWPQLAEFLPLGGIEELSERAARSREILRTREEMLGSDALISVQDTLRLAIAMVGTIVLMIPISWVYFITTRAKEVDPSFAQTIVVLPVVVAGIATIVQNSLALAFSLAGIVAAVRFRFTLDEPAHALYIFAAIGVGLSSGIDAIGVALVISVAFVYINLTLWKLDYGDNLSGPFFSFLAGRDRDDGQS